MRPMTWLFIVAASVSVHARADDFHICHDVNELVYRGAITKESAEALIRHLRAGARRLTITSGGGDAAAGQKIGAAVAELGVHVTVARHCLSACANYVFLAGRTKTLLRDAVVGFHGGLVRTIGKQEKDPSRLSELNRQMELLYQADDDLFRKLGISQELLLRSYKLTAPTKKPVHLLVKVDGSTYFETEQEQLDEALAAEAITKAFASKKHVSVELTAKNASPDTFYFPSQATLRGFGVKGIVSYPYPKSADELRQLGLATVEGIKLVGDL
ncbi:hypothetical protein [Pseudoduganella sp. GCM10020061]|uniref:hypothetical protein n=1 Tax=Pseudoduganella sp. GCM10020061 TaxID=3317345 RepID=UPI003624AE38